MIVINSFVEAHALYQQGKLDFCLLQDQAAVLLSFNPKPGREVIESVDVDDSDITWLRDEPYATEEYNGLLGGEVYVCEGEDDLNAVVGMDLQFAKENDNRWPNVTELIMSWDVCDYVKVASANPRWVKFLLCCNDAGGCVYYVPEPLWQSARVIEHIAATEKFWGTA